MALHPNTISPFTRLREIFLSERADILLLLAYTLFSGLLMLAVPLAAQAMVNTLAAGVFLQPLIVMTTVLLIGLSLAAALQLMQVRLVERLQERVFARVALNIARHLPRIDHAALSHEYPPELANRFFDVLTVQKMWAKLLLEAPAAGMKVLLGLALLALYSPYLLAFDVVLLLFLCLVMPLLGLGGLRTSIAESESKYAVAGWLQELARCQANLKVNGNPGALLSRTDQLVSEYIQARRRHFAVVFRQAVGSQLFQAIAATGILAVGGWLVIERKLTLGQLVAAEIVVISIVEALEKLSKHIEPLYDLLTGLHKIGHVVDLPQERDGGQEPPSSPKGARIELRALHFSYPGGKPVLRGIDLHAEAGERIALVGPSGCGKSTVAALLAGLVEARDGSLSFDSVPLQSIGLAALRNVVALVGSGHDVFAGTLRENVVTGRSVTPEQTSRAIRLAGLAEEVTRMPDGLETLLVSEGRNLSRGQAQRVLLARAIVDSPRLLILDEIFAGIDDSSRHEIIDNLYEQDNPWTILQITHDPAVALRADRVLVLDEGRIVESFAPRKLSSCLAGRFFELFPSARHLAPALEPTTT